MGAGKKELLAQFQKDWKKYWGLDTLVQLGFKRFICKKCGKAYWALQEQQTCNDSSCRPYDFIGKPVGKKMDYFKTWEAIEKFFVKEGHAPLKRYPVVCRWYPLFFTIAGIVDFYRMDGDKLMFEFPANPSILDQPCLRFNDIPNVGVSGRHFTCFNMVQQSALYDGKRGYWKDRCLDLNYRLLTDVFDIRPNEINFIEDVWLGHGAFGYSLEYHIRGLETGNMVFTEFAGTPEKFAPMKEKIIDMGAGHERFTWLLNGTNTAYDCVFGPVMEKMRTKAGVRHDERLFNDYSKLAGQLNMDEVADIEAVRREIAKKLGVTVAELKERVEPMQALYAIADHSKALLFAMTDGGLPSNVGGGYNLRVILRRALSFMDRFRLPFDLIWAAERNAQYLKPMYPELEENLPKIQEILQVEEKRYRSGMEKAKKIVESVVSKGGTIKGDEMVELYDSHGITPELVQEAAEKRGIKVAIPPDLYAKVSERHMKKEREKAKLDLDVSGLPVTKKLYYEDMKMKAFEAKVLKVIDGKFVILDRTAFYPRGGGQEPDHGTMGDRDVYDVEKIDEVVVHSVDGPKLKAGEQVRCELDWERRRQITIHHDATHIINSAARKVLGPWVWQEGSKKDIDKAHIDVDHYDALSEEQVKKIEAAANEIIKKALPIEKFEMKRTDAEKKFGFGIYQGAAVPSRTLRIIKTGDEVEACGGTHGDNTKELGRIIIIKTERPADGTVRFVYKAGPAAERHFKEMEKVLKLSANLLEVKEADVPKAAAELFEKWKAAKKKFEKLQLKLAEKKTEGLELTPGKGLRFLVKDISNAGADQLREISKKLSAEDTVILLIGLSDKAYVFGSAGQKAVKAGINIGKVVSETCAVLGGKGGGSPILAQGSGPEKTKIKDALKKARGMLLL
ncbi:MAG: alanine--tRNA ligase [Candidatus Aenigmatarchaeota archaeon]